MVEHNIKRYVSAIIFTFLFILFGAFIINNWMLNNFLNIWELITTSVTITSFIVILFVSFLWRFRIFQGWLVPFPNLNGEWEGKIKYNYDNIDYSRKVYVQIKQSFCSIIVKFNSKESKSNTFCGSLNIDKNRDVKQLIYSYYNEPDANIRERSPLHYGTTKLDIQTDNKMMLGEYWTNRGSQGAITLEKAKKQ